MINLITDLISFTQPTNLDRESLSVIESIAKIKTKVNECINEFNNLENKTNEDYNNFRNDINSFKTSIEKICEDLTKDNNSFKNEFREIIKALENFNVTLEIINKQCEYIQELAKINQDNIDKGTIATKDEINKINSLVDSAQAQINNLVLGAVGNGNNAEVVQARGFFKLLNDRLTYISDKIGLKFYLIDGRWTYPRGYNSTDGNQTSNSAMTATDFIECKKYDMVCVDNIDNFKTTVYKYDSNRKFIGCDEVAKNYYYIAHEGYITVSAYSQPITNPITEQVATACKNNISIIKVESKDMSKIDNFVGALDNGLNDAIHVNTPYVTNSNKQKIRVEKRSYTKYPLYPVWGHEYLSHWYKKIYNVEMCKIVSDGDSITEGYDAQGTYTDAFKDMRGKALKRIMKAGNFDMSKLTVFNNGKSGTSTNDWIGKRSFMIDSLLNSGVDYTNGKLHYSMAENPDLLIISFGMNDAAIGGFDSSNQSLQYSLSSRLELFESNYREGLQRIRGNVVVNGREAYNKSVDDLSIILTTPTVTSMDSLTWHNMHDYEKWHMYVKEIIMGLAREFKCGYVDFTSRTYGHIDADFNNWSVFNADNSNYRFHPNIYSNMQFHSLLQDLIYPVCFWNLNVE